MFSEDQEWSRADFVSPFLSEAKLPNQVKESLKILIPITTQWWIPFLTMGPGKA